MTASAARAHDRSKTSTRLAVAVLVGGLIANGLLPAESRGLVFFVAGASAAGAGWALTRSEKHCGYALVLIGAGLTLTPLVPIAPLCGALAYGIWFSRSDVSRVPLMVWGVAVVLAGVAGLAVWWWAKAGPPTLRFIDMPMCCAEPFFTTSLVVGAAAANSIYEEVLWRHVLPVALGRPRVWVAVALSLRFGAAHMNSLPGGASGVLMTTIFALVSHALVKAANGSLLPSIGVHFVADVVLLTAVLS